MNELARFKMPMLLSVLSAICIALSKSHPNAVVRIKEQWLIIECDSDLKTQDELTARLTQHHIKF